MRLLSAADIDAAWPIDVARDTLAGALRAISQRRGQVAERQHLAVPGHTGLLMGALVPGIGLAAKLVSIVPGNRAQGLPGTLGSVLLCDDSTGQPLALLDATALTARRTAAVIACAVDALAAPEARQAVLIGCGSQAAALVRALDAVRSLETIAVHARTPAHVAAFIEREQPGLRARLVPVSAPGQAIASAQLVVTATSSDQPVFDADQLAPGAHVSAMGSYRPGVCEFDPALCRRARVFVESRAAAETEAGELIAARDAGWTRAADWAELGEVLAGDRPGREDEREITVFKTVGHVLFDLYAARAVYDRALETGLGVTWNP